MRLHSFINEYKEQVYEVSGDQAVKILKKECSKYLKETKGKWFYRGFMKPIEIEMNELGYSKIRKNRIPRGTNKEAFKWFNEWLQKNGHVRRDQSISMTSDLFHQLIQKPYVCFVQGNYDYTWIATGDVNVTDIKTKWYSNAIEDNYFISTNKYKEFKGNLLIKSNLFKKYVTNGDYEEDEFMNLYIRRTKEWLDNNFKKYFHTNEGITKAWDNEYEIWFKAKGYYYVKYKSELYYYLKDNL